MFSLKGGSSGLKLKKDPTAEQATRPCVLVVRPWLRLSKYSKLMFGNQFYDDVIKPTLVDPGEDYIEAMAHNHELEATVIKWRSLLFYVSKAFGRFMKLLLFFWRWG